MQTDSTDAHLLCELDDNVFSQQDIIIESDLPHRTWTRESGKRSNDNLLTHDADADVCSCISCETRVAGGADALLDPLFL